MLAPILIGCGQGELEPTAPITPVTSALKLEILSSEMIIVGVGDHIVKGVAKNISGQDLTYAELKVYFIDADGNRLKDYFAKTSVSYVKADELWNFQARCGVPQGNVIIKGYEIEEGISY